MKIMLNHAAAQRAVSLLGIIALMVGLTSCSSADEGTSGSTNVKLATLAGFGTYPLRVAVEQGFFEDHGVDLELVKAASPTDFIPGLGKQYDIVVPTVSDMIQGVARGADVRALTGLVETTLENPNAPLITTAKAGPIESGEDLEGKIIGVAGLTTNAAISIKWLLLEAGLSADAATLVAVPPPAMADQLDAGAITAASMFAPFSGAAVGEGFVAGVDPAVVAGGDPSPAAALATTQKWVDANPEAADAISAALDEAIAWIADNPEEAIADVAKWLQIEPSVLEEVRFPEFTTRITLEQIEPWVKILTDVGIISTPVDPEDLLVVR